tara:strand:+ start:387 stop:866 length:480 start_codon:yes stop_codon:yes gene_type:complete
MITKENYFTAYFIDNDRYNIDVLTRSDDDKKLISTIIPFDPENVNYQQLMKIITLDELHENTYVKKNKEREEFERQVLKIARKENLIMDGNIVDTKFLNLMVDTIFNYTDREKDQLFALKIALFEVDKIKNAPNDEKKSKLRKANTLIEALQSAFDLIK